MRILNIMLGKGKGGIEQAVLDYAEALTHGGHKVVNVLDPNGWALREAEGGARKADNLSNHSPLVGLEHEELVPTDQFFQSKSERSSGAQVDPVRGKKAHLTPHQNAESILTPPQGGSVTGLKNLGAWDILAASKLHRITQEHHADALICHGNRAISLGLKACKGRIPVIGVAHNYNIKRFGKLDGGFAITQDLCSQLHAQGLPEGAVFHMPNMVRTPEVMPERPAFRSPPVIGSMGRFVKKKGFEVYIEALALLQQRGITFEAVLGGGGEEENALKALAEKHQLPLTFSGWVEDKKAFYDGLDIFVLPSHHEPFGIVLIEAMAEGLPVVSTASEGPSEILSGGAQGLLVPLNDPEATANALQTLIENQSTACELGEHAYSHCAQEYSLLAMSERLSHALDEIVTTHM